MAVPIPLELHAAAMHQALAPLAPVDAAHEGRKIESLCAFECVCVCMGEGRGGHHGLQPGPRPMARSPVPQAMRLCPSHKLLPG